MKNPEAVKKAIAILHANAESDFEHHHIDILERALTNPPVATQTDDTHQEFNGVVYAKSHSGHYSAGLSIHREVWAYYNGNIPNGYVIHHIDSNPANNDISNLQMLTQSEHKRIHHHQSVTRFICEVCGEEYDGCVTGTNRFCSNRCATKYRYYKREYVKQCEWCGAEFTTHKKDTRFCSWHCSSQFKFQNDHIEKICPICGTPFKTKKSDDLKTCSYECGLIYREQNRKSVNIEKVCPMCGQSFIAHHKAAKYCSSRCKDKARYPRKRKQQQTELTI